MSAQLAEIPNTELALLPPSDRARALLRSDVLAPKLTALAAESAHIVAITNADGYKQAHAKRMVLKNERIALEKDGKGMRDDANAFAKAVIAEEKRLIGIVSPEEDRLEALQSVWDAAIEADKQAKARALREEAEALAARIRAIQDVPANAAGKSCAEIAAAVREVEAIDLESFPEASRQTAQNARDAALARLAIMYADRKGFEEEQARVQVERELLERQRAEQEAERVRLAKIVEDEQAELKAFAQIVIDCHCQCSEWMQDRLFELERDPPVNPSDIVSAAYRSTISQLTKMVVSKRDAELIAFGIREEAEERDRQEAAARAQRDAVEAAERAERARVDDLRRRIDIIRHVAQMAVGKSSATITEMRETVGKLPCDYAELTPEALDAQRETLAELDRMHAEAFERERMDAEFRQRADEDAKRKAQAAADERAEAERKAKEAADLETAETQRTVTTCTLSEAAGVALSYLQSIGHGECLGAQMLASALERTA